MKYKLLITLLLAPIFAIAQIAENFENGNINAWKQTPANRWSASTNQPLEGVFSLRQTFDNSTADKDKISVPVANIDVTAGTTTWKFLVRHGYNPSSSNYWAAFLMSDSDADNMEKGLPVNAYAVGVNLNGSSDILCLYKITNGVPSELINTNFNWEKRIASSGKAGLEITRKQNGEWSVSVDTLGNFQNFIHLGTPIVDTDHAIFNFFGLLYSYTASADQKFWFDRLSITSTAVAAQILSIAKTDKRTLSVTFSKEILQLGNVKLYDENGNQIQINSTSFSSKADSIIISTEKLIGRKFALEIGGFIDVDGKTVAETKTFMIANYNFGDVVFNEIMYRPEPTVGLPNRKYIEIYNRTNYPIYLDNWKILYGANGTSRISADTINAQSYAILCVSTAVNDLSVYGKTIAATSFPSLTYTGQDLQLIDHENNLIDKIEFLPAWHSDSAKIEGGWSLEKIDFNNLAGTKDNWASSADNSGGTPGRANSTMAQNADTQAPNLLNWEIVTVNKLQLTFNEPIDENVAEKLNVYFADNNLGTPANITVNYNVVVLEFSTDIDLETIYTLNISSEFADLAGNSIGNNFNFEFGMMKIPQRGDIIINEVLFNPKAGGVDFVEIYNYSQKNLDLKDLFLATRNDANGDLQSIYKVSEKNRFFAPQNFAVLTTDSVIITQQYFVANPSAIIEMSKMPTYANASGRVVLLNELNESIDEFQYNEKMHFAFLTDVKGVSLERANYNAPTSDVNNWHSASSDVGYATPTYKNSQAAVDDEKYGFTVSPKTFAPEADFDNEISIEYKMPESGYLANIKIFDSRGMLVTDLQRNVLLGTEGKFLWKGQNNHGQRAAVGVYIIYIEYFNLEGKIFREKKTCVLAARK